MKKLSETLKEQGIVFTFPIEIKHANGESVYYEDSTGFRCKYEYDARGNETYYEDSDGFWNNREYNAFGNLTYYEDSDGIKRGIPRSQSCDGTVVEIDGLKYELKLTK
tara:strand:- start:913 stop:1236 length:324 start_codon:yes stop_codon:yes gene_type:complete